MCSPGSLGDVDDVYVHSNSEHAVAITLSLTTLVPYSTITSAWYPMVRRHDDFVVGRVPGVGDSH